MERELWYSQPAQGFTQALPLGNGSLGAMVFGGAGKERIMLNHDALWSGNPQIEALAPVHRYTKLAQELALEGKLADAQQVLERHVLGNFHESYLPMGELVFTESLIGTPSKYRRSLDLYTASCTTEYLMDGCLITRQVYASYPDQAIIIKWQATRPVDLHISLTSQLKSKLGNGLPLRLLGQCPSRVEPNYVDHLNPVRYEEQRPGIAFAMGVEVKTDGRQQMNNMGLAIQDATSVILVLMAKTSFKGFQKNPADPGWDCDKHLLSALSAINIDEDTLWQNHLADYQALEGACVLDLQSPKSPLPTDQRLLAFDGQDLGLYELLFRYGRYLLIASSRPGSQPANLQGIWNQDLRAPWSSNYTININTQMNYWPVFSANLASCALPLLGMVQELAMAGQQVAQAVHDAKGWCAHHNVDLWRNCTPVGNHQAGSACYGYWPLGGIWLCLRVWEYYQYTGDLGYLQDTGFAILSGAADFVLSQLVENQQGKLILPLMTSPENTFLREGKVLAVDAWAAMGQSLAGEVLLHTSLARKALGMDKDTALDSALMQLAPLAVGSDGRLLEWSGEWPENEPQHRHLSHLYALYPGRSITKGNPLMTAARSSLLARGDEGTGWSLAWKVNLWARLQEGDKALSLLSMQLRRADDSQQGQGGGSYDNLFSAHPPFQIDGNFGAVAGIMEMLLQQVGEELHLLPALPGAWPKGSLLGACAPGGLVIDLAWQQGRLTEAKVKAKQAGVFRLRYRDIPYLLHLEEGQQVSLPV